MSRYLSGRSKLTPQSGLQSDRYRYLSIENAEPNLGDPLVGPSSVTAKPIPPGQQFIIVSVEGSTSGERYWIPNQGGIIPGSISVFDDNTLVGALSSITQLNFVGAAITASVSIASSNLATVRVFSPGNSQEIIFNTANEFSTSTKLKFDPSNGLLTAGDRIIVGAGGTVITTTGVGSVGIGTTNPTQELHLQGDLRLTGTIYDYLNQPGTENQLLVKNALGGVIWINQGTIRAGAGGTYQNIQFHNSAGLVDGALNFVFDDINNRIGIGSTQPKVLLDVLGISSFKGGTSIDNLIVTGIATIGTLGVTGTTTTRNFQSTGISTLAEVDINAGEIDVTRIETQNLKVIGVTTVGFVTGTDAYFTGIVTARKFVGEVNVSNLYVTGISTFLQKVNINSDLGVTGLTTTQNLQVYQSTTLNRLKVTGISTFDSQVNINNLNVTGVGTFDNIKLDSNTISTNDGNLVLDSSAGTTQINDAIYVNDSTESTSKDGGSIVTEGGVGIEKNLNVGGQLNVGGATTLASAGGITTTGGDLYVKGDLYVSDDIFYDELFARNGYFTGITSTKDLNVTGVATIATLGVTGLTTTRNLQVTGFSTFTGVIDANGGAYIDNIQIGISGDNEIDTTSGNLTIDSFAGTTTIDDQLIVSGITTISNTTDSTNKDTGALIVEGGVGIEKNLNVGNNLTVSGISTFNGNVTLGDATSDTVSFTSRINSSVLPSTNSSSGTDANGKDLGGTSNYWRKIYAQEFNGQFIGNADTATKLAATKNFSITGDVDAPAVSFDGTGNVNLVTTLDNTGVTAGTYGSSTQVGIVTVDAKGRITSASNVGINFSAATVAQSDAIKTVTSSAITLYPTFVDSDNNPAAYESLYTDAGISYDASTNLLNISGSLNLSSTIASTATAILTRGADNNFQLTAQNGPNINASGQEVSRFGINYSGFGWNTFLQFIRGGGATDGSLAIYTNNTARLLLDSSGNLLPQGTSETLNLGGTSNGWNNVYAKTFVGAITGNADTVTKLQTPRNIDIDGDVIGVGIGTTFDGSQNVTIPTELSTTGVTAGTYGSSTQVGIVTVDAKGRITSASNVGINFSTATVAQSDAIKTVTSSAITLYPTFVDSDNNPAAYEALYTDGDISYNASTNLLTIPKIKPAEIQDTAGGTGSDNFVLTANGTGGWTWKVAGTSGGTAAIGGITVQEQGSTVGTAAGITTVNFVGDDITATASGSIATITLTTTAGIATFATTAGIATYATNAGIATNIIGGSANQVLYKNASNVATTSANFTFDGSRAVLGPYAGSTTYLTPTTNDPAKDDVVGLEIKNNGGTGENDVAAISFHCQTQYGMHMHLRNDGFFGIGGWSALAWRWYVNMNNGTMAAAGDIIAFVSDERLKENIQPLENALDKVLTLNGFTYNFNETGQSLGFDGTVINVGVSAQKVQAVLPEAVKPAPVDSDYLTVQYEKLVPLLIEAIKEQQETITNLQNRIELLEGK